VIIFGGITHSLTSVALFLFIAKHLNSNIPVFPTVIFIVLFSLLPDIDSPFSLIGRFFPFNVMMKHRGITHTMAGLAIFTIPVLLTGNPYIVFGSMYGYASHLFMDLLTPMGLKIWYPFSKRKFTYNLCRTGGFSELALFSLSLMYILLK